MSDKQLIQQQLANQLGALLLKIPNEIVFKFLRAFWKIIISEWNGLDRLRYKYVYVIIFNKNNWKEISKFNTIKTK